jgi:signal peptidase
MEPALPPGTMIVVRPTDPDEIRPGAVLTYQLRSGEPALVTHRVVQRQRLADGTTVFVTKGDANAQPDADPVREVQITGTVWYAIPCVGWATALVTGEARAVAVPLAAGALLAYAAWMALSAARERRDARSASPAEGASASAPRRRRSR